MFKGPWCHHKAQMMLNGPCLSGPFNISYALWCHQRPPAGTRRNDNVFTASTRRRRRRVDVVKTLSLRHYCVMCPLGGRVGVTWSRRTRYQHRKRFIGTRKTWFHPPQGIADVIWARRIWCHQREHLMLHGPEGHDARKGCCSCCMDQKTRCHLTEHLMLHGLEEHDANLGNT